MKLLVIQRWLQSLDTFLMLASFTTFLFIFAILVNIIGIICLKREKRFVKTSNPLRVVLTNLSAVEISLSLVLIYIQGYCLVHVDVHLPRFLDAVVPLYSLSLVLVLLDPFMFMFTGLKYDHIVNEAHMKKIIVLLWCAISLLTVSYMCEVFASSTAGSLLETSFLFGLLTWLFKRCRNRASVTLAPLSGDGGMSGMSFSLFKGILLVCGVSALLFFLMYHVFYGSMIVAYFYFLVMAVNLVTHPMLYIFWNFELRRICVDMLGPLLPVRLRRSFALPPSVSVLGEPRVESQ